MLSVEISRDLPNFTLHDQAHTDALWDLADLVAGQQYTLTPTEAFVFGCAVAIHDIAMTSSALTGPPTDYVTEAQWRDLVYTHFTRAYSRYPEYNEIEHPPDNIVALAQAELLRETHAEKAALMPRQNFTVNGSTFHLIQDVDLRNWYGDLVGRIAASHGWSEEKLVEEFDYPLGAPGVLPRDWTVDPLKLACLLRIADSCHIDSSRAPTFLHAVRNISGESTLHWTFQERLQKPRLEGDRLVFTASQPFDPTEAEAWWLCIDTIRYIDRGLHAVDSILADTRRPRLAARSVAYTDDLRRLSRLIPVRDWQPVDTRVRVGNVIDLVKKLGGSELYGNNPEVGLRELVSNAADAVRARRYLQKDHEEIRLRILVRLTTDGTDTWLSVADNGIGMTPKVMSGPLLDFGESYWVSSPARRDLPGLISSGFRPTGRFGIGFFSVFMLGQHVKVVSCRCDAGQAETHVLEFHEGLDSRPLLRKATNEEFIRLGGTEVSVKLDPAVARKLFSEPNPSTLSELCARDFPTLDVALDVDDGEGKKSEISPDDWKTIPAPDLLRRIGAGKDLVDRITDTDMRPLYDHGQMVGRLAMVPYSPGSGERLHTWPSTVTVGGARSESWTPRACGVLLGDSLTAARDFASPLVQDAELARWATEQGELVAERTHTPEEQLEYSSIITSLNGDTGSLFVAECKNGYLSRCQISEWAKQCDTVYIYQDASFILDIRRAVGDEDVARRCLHENVLVTNTGIPAFLNNPHRVNFPYPMHQMALEDLCAFEIGRSWKVPDSAIRDALDKHTREEKEWEAERPDFAWRIREQRYFDPARPHVAPVATLSSGKIISAVVLSLCREELE